MSEGMFYARKVAAFYLGSNSISFCNQNIFGKEKGSFFVQRSPIKINLSPPFSLPSGFSLHFTPPSINPEKISDQKRREMDIKGTPVANAYYMPAEWEPHSQTWMGWPVSKVQTRRWLSFLSLLFS